MTTLESNRCYVCGKIFCCAECCTNHIRNKHPDRESKCPLCRSQRLMVKNFENQEFLCHVVFHHLPLYCCLCGEQFKSCSDLACLGGCSRRPVARITPLIQDETGKSLLCPETPSPLNKTPSGQAIPQGKEFSIEGDYNGNFGSFTSPPELYRNTSTPMHVNLVGYKSNIVLKTPRSPSFTLKTPKTNLDSVNVVRRNDLAGTKENSETNDTDPKDADSPSSESNYVSLSSFSRSALTDRTPLRSILSNRPMIDNSNQESSRNTGRKLGAMQELDEDAGVEEVDSPDMELTDPQGQILQDECFALVASENVSQRRQKEHRDSVKRVRFSDQFEVKSESEVTRLSSLNATENEEFFEARQSMSEMSLAVVEQLSASSALIDRENEENSEKERVDEIPDSAETQSQPEPSESNGQNTATATSSSRVVMMVVLEKNGTVNTSDLGPLIDSSLKKLEVITANGGQPRQNPIELPPQRSHSGSPLTSVVSVDSYTSVSSIECYSTPDSTMNVPSPRESPEPSNAVAATGGIFSAVAHAMRTALRNLSGATSSRNIPREHVPQKESPALLSSNPETSVASANVLTSLASNLLVPRSTKRSRDTEELLQPLHSTDPVDPHDIRSPVPKRPRGWYKIRGREPIARMRNNHLTSPRGVSLETQCFQQGSLSVGDTILPIPARAHQATQTD